MSKLGYKPAITPALSDYLNLVRGLSAVAVVMSHGRMMLMGNLTKQPGGIDGIVEFGFVAATGFAKEAVLAFFVMSGLLIAPKLLVPENQNSRYLKGYLADRLTRIYVVAIPALILSVAVAWMTFAYFGYNASFHRTDCRPSLSDLGTSLLFLDKAFVPIICSNDPYWSIHNEMVYYLLWPAIILAALGRELWLRAISVMFAATLIIALLLSDPWGKMNTLALMPVWIFGGLCLYLPRLRGPFALYAGFFVFALLLSNAPVIRQYWLFTSMLIGLSGGLFFRRAVEARPMNRWLAKISDYFAKISFSLYLTHAIVLNLLVTSLWSLPGVPPYPAITLTSFAVWLIFVLSSVIFSHLFYSVFEKHTPRVRNLLREWASDPARTRNTPA